MTWATGAPGACGDWPRSTGHRQLATVNWPPSTVGSSASVERARNRAQTDVFPGVVLRRLDEAEGLDLLRRRGLADQVDQRARLPRVLQRDAPGGLHVGQHLGH